MGYQSTSAISEDSLPGAVPLVRHPRTRPAPPHVEGENISRLDYECESVSGALIINASNAWAKIDVPYVHPRKTQAIVDCYYRGEAMIRAPIPRWFCCWPVYWTRGVTRLLRVDQ